VVEQANTAKRRRARPKDTDQAWYYHPAYEALGEALLSFIKTDDRWRRRSYDFHSGREIGDTVSAGGDHRSAFAADLEGAVRLNGHWDAKEIREWGGELPSSVLDLLHRDLDAARAEFGSADAPAATETVAERPAAS
jgi:hypothetical protein